MKYIRVPLTVGVVYSTNGIFKPRAIFVGGERFLIDKVISKKNYCPKSVGAIAPIEFTVMVEGERKKIYFEKDTDKWFSVKRALENEGQGDFTQRC